MFVPWPLDEVKPKQSNNPVKENTICFGAPAPSPRQAFMQTQSTRCKPRRVEVSAARLPGTCHPLSEFFPGGSGKGGGDPLQARICPHLLSGHSVHSTRELTSVCGTELSKGPKLRALGGKRSGESFKRHLKKVVKEGDEKVDQDVHPRGRDFWKERGSCTSRGKR